MFDSNDPFGSFTASGSKPSVPQSSVTNSGGTPFGGGLPNSNATEQKYQILNLFWLINIKAYTNEPLLEGEVHFTSISYNVNFGNLRIELATMTNESIVGQMICLNKVNRIVNATVYPTAMFQLVCGVPEVICMEQIINYSNADWQNKLKPAKFVTSEKGIILTIENNCYEFTDWQKEALLYSCKFGLNNGLSLSGHNLKK